MNKAKEMKWEDKRIPSSKDEIFIIELWRIAKRHKYYILIFLLGMVFSWWLHDLL